MGSESHALDVLDLLVKPLGRPVGLVVTPCVFDAPAVVTDAVGGLPDGRAFTGEIPAEPFRQSGAAVLEGTASGDVVER